VRVVGAILALALAAPAPAAERVVDRLAAVVNDDVIALSEIYELGSDEIARRCPTGGDACRAEAEREVLDSLVDRTLKRQELARLGLDVTPAEIDETIDDVVATYQFGDRDALRAEVEARGFTWDAYRRLQIEEPLRDRKFVEIVLRSRVTMSDEELRDAYQRLVRSLERPDLVRLEAAGRPVGGDGPDALVQAVAAARAVAARVRSGEATWEEAAAEWDTAGLRSAFSGARFQRGELAEPLGDAAFGVEPGEVAEPVVANGLVVLVRVLTRELGEVEVKPFEEAKDGLAEQIFLSKVEQADEEWRVQARRRSAVRTYLPAPSAPAASPTP
jgi:parvulin-like peptidyl-prolyl isomerase